MAFGSTWDNVPLNLPKELLPPRTPFAPRRQRRGRNVVGQYASQQAYEASLGRATQQLGEPRKVVTVSDAGVYRIQPLDDKVGIGFGVSAELLVRESNAVSVFVGHPDDVSFDSMDLSVTGRTGVAPAVDDPVGWVAEAQLVQRKGDKEILISGAWKERDKEMVRRVTTLSAYSNDTVTELNGGFIEKPWGLFVNIGLTRVLGSAGAIPSDLADLRIQVTVNLISYAT